MTRRINLNINGIPRTVFADPEDSLAKVLREQLGLTGTKVGCGAGQCGACSVLLDGKVVRSCITKMARVPENASIVTIEGIGTPDNLHPLQVAWINYGGVQCGFCSPGLHRLGQGSAGREPHAHPGRGARLVPEAPQRLPLHRLQAPGRRRHGGGQGPAGRGDDGGHQRQLQGRTKTAASGTPTTRGPPASPGPPARCDYGADLGLKLPKDTLHLALVQSKVSHANILSIDTSEAEKMPGVAKVITHKDVKGSNRIFGLLIFPWNKGDGYDRPLLCDDEGLPVR